jgi:tripartite-type tricarboxylate transporter receptor subunit TctC
MMVMCVATGGAVAAAKSGYPNKPIEMVVAFPAGGGQDATFRFLAKYADKHAGVRIVMLNKVAMSIGGT